jgi:hypothetical protein
MRIAAFALMAGLAGCSLPPSEGGSECQTDSQCGDDVCARSGECLVRSTVREVTVKWTVNGAPADESSCASNPDLFLQFDGADYGDVLRFAPVPCRLGSFFIDKLPKRFVQVELGSEGGVGDISAIDAATAQAQFDLSQ